MISRPTSRRLLSFLLAPAAVAAMLAAAAGAGWPFHRDRAQPDCPCQHPAAPEPTPEAAIRQVLDDQVAAWNRGDLEAFMAGYWSSPDLTYFSGSDRSSGWQATLDRYRKRYKSEGKEMGRLTFSDVSVDVLCSDAALVRGAWRLALSKETPGGLFTLIFRRLPEGWRIIHDHTSK
ncbi:MAG TPA: nuclear transport factor 2 family protein [Gemmataceae bacterium]|nr:nuclear transport factor 2 family protein [Gemmataceae bacterium]